VSTKLGTAQSGHSGRRVVRGSNEVPWSCQCLAAVLNASYVVSNDLHIAPNRCPSASGSMGEFDSVGPLQALPNSPTGGYVMPARPTVLIADGHVGIADAVTRFLGVHFATLPPVHTIAFLRGVLALLEVDVVLLELDLGTNNAIDVLPILVSSHPTVRFVVYTGLTSSHLASLATRLGAHGFVQKSATLADIEMAIHESLAGRQPHLPRVADTGQLLSSCGVARCRKGDWAPTRDKIIWLLAAGWTQSRVRDSLMITKKDMEFQMRRIRTIKPESPPVTVAHPRLRTPKP
jgi:DNA-binding NarL/FixJ family response regulator